MDGLIVLGLIVGFLWSISTLRELKDGQAEVLQRLTRIEEALRTPSNVVNSTDDQ